MYSTEIVPPKAPEIPIDRLQKQIEYIRQIKQKKSVKKFCTNCGAKINSDQKFCSYCGNKLV